MTEMPDAVVIVANSGRMLAEAAAEAGIKAFVIDLFADTDTAQLAASVSRVPSLAKVHVEAAVDDLIGRFRVAHAIYGSGLEAHADTLQYLAGRLRLLGNAPDTFVRLHDKPGFFSALDELSIEFPEVSFREPGPIKGWLVKPMRGQGGAGIKRYRSGMPLDAGVYWQKFQPGAAHSVLFLCDGRQARVVGYNRQWSSGLSKDAPFMFSGIVNRCRLSDEQRSMLDDWCRRCGAYFSLKGLNSLDFIESNGRCLVLEINPRPTAGMQLHAGLLPMHVMAVNGALPDEEPKQRGAAAYSVVYAPADLEVPDGVDWPEECRDKPGAGVICRKGGPICSIISTRSSNRQVFDRLKQVRQHILNQMIKVQPHGI